MSKRFIAMYLACSVILCVFTASAALRPGGVFAVQGVPHEPRADAPVIVIDAGHGGEDPGTIGIDGVYEKDLNLAIAKCLYGLLSAAGYRTVLTRTEDKLLYTEAQNIPGKKKVYDLYNRVQTVNSYEDAVLISIHMNNFSSRSAGGLQVWYKAGDMYSRGLAEAVRAKTVAWLQPKNSRRIMESTSAIYVLSNSSHPAVLIECGFLSNPEDCEKLQNEMYQKELSLTIFYAIIEYIELNKEGIKTI